MRNKLEIKIPNDVTEIRLGQYQQYLKLVEGLGDDFELNEFIKIRIVSIFCDVPVDLVRIGFKAKLIDSISKDIINLLKEFDNETQFKPTFTLGETKFGFINNLDDMLAGEYADLSTYFTVWDTMHKAMAVMYRPIVKEMYNPIVKLTQYELNEYNGTEQYGELMKQMPAIKAIQASFFLINSYRKLQKCFLVYMEKQIAENPEIDSMLNLNSIETGDGIKAFIALLEKTSSTLSV